MPPPGASEYASQSLLGDQITPPTGSLSLVISVGQPPSVGTTHICGTPFKSDTNASFLPSGENVAEPARPTFAMRVTSVANSVAVCASVVMENKTVVTRRRELRRMEHLDERAIVTRLKSTDTN